MAFTKINRSLTALEFGGGVKGQASFVSRKFSRPLLLESILTTPKDLGIQHLGYVTTFCIGYEPEYDADKFPAPESFHLHTQFFETDDNERVN